MSAQFIPAGRLLSPIVVATGLFVGLPPVSVAQTAGAEAAEGLEEITITAERREETLQRSSLSVEVLDTEALRKAGVAQAIDLTAAIPGVQVGSGGPQPQVYIRGIGDYGATSVSNPAIAFNVDGVYVARSTAVAGNFYDLARIEVLKGPQGTLYGRNASGGAINLVPNLPNMEGFSGYAQVGVQNYGGKSAEAALNIPLGSTLAGRVSAEATDRDGYLSDGSSDENHASARIQLLWKPTNALDLRLWGAYARARGKGTGFALYDSAHAFIPASLDPWTSITGPEANAIIAAGNAVLATVRGPSPTGSWLDPFSAANVRQDIETYNTHAEINLRADWATLTVLPAYQSARLSYRTYPALSYATTDLQGTPETSYTTSLEARLGNNTERVKWVVGAFYYEENQNSRSTIDNGFTQRLSVTGTQETRSQAVFGQMTYSVAEPWRIIAGLRYTRERKQADFTRYNFVPAAECFFGGAPGTPTVCFNDAIGKRVSDDATNYRVGMEYDLSERNMLFATVASGFKAGGIAQANVSAFRPEKLTAYTLGSRNRFWSDTLQVNVEGFYYDYRDHQEFVVGADDTGKIGAFPLNAGDATSYGGSVDIVWAPTRADHVRLAAEYLHARYDSFVYWQPTFTITSTGCQARIDPSRGTVNLGGGVVSPVSRIDCSGQAMIRAPKWSGLFGYEHSFDLGSHGALAAGVDLTFAAERQLSVDFIPNTLAPSYTVWNANVAYTAPGGALEVTAFVRNIGDEAVYTGALQNSWLPGFVGVNVGAPRTYGLQLRVQF